MASHGKRVLVPVADGSEDIELSCITDVLVRAGVDVTVASVMPDKRLHVTLARQLQVTANTHITDVKASLFDGVLIPGGLPGANHLAACNELREITVDLFHHGKLVGAICASPAIVLGPFGVLNDLQQVTCYPGMKDKLPPGMTWSDERVMLGKNVLTSQGPGTSIDFALVAVAILVDPHKAADVAKGLLVTLPPLVARMMR